MSTSGLNTQLCAFPLSRAATYTNPVLGSVVVAVNFQPGNSTILQYNDWEISWWKLVPESSDRGGAVIDGSGAELPGGLLPPGGLGTVATGKFPTIKSFFLTFYCFSPFSSLSEK